MIRVLFVCLGNICRSAAANGVMEDFVEREGLSDKIIIDSAGTYGGHAGELPDPRMRVAASRRGYNLTHRSRRIKEDDFYNFDMIIVMENGCIREQGTHDELYAKGGLYSALISNE